METLSEILGWDTVSCDPNTNDSITLSTITTFFIKRLQELTKTNFDCIDVFDKKFIALILQNDMTGVYELENNDIQALISALKPSSFDELIKIYILAHEYDINYIGVEKIVNMEDFQKTTYMQFVAKIKVTKSLIIAWYKLNYPQAFYQAYFETYVCNNYLDR